MRIIDWDDFAADGIESDEPVSFTTGVFDGVHLGHYQLLDCLKSQANLKPVLATFVGNPFRLLRPDSFKGDITTLRQKLRLLEDVGCWTVILIDFSMKFSKLSGRDFFAYIIKHLNLSHLVLGKDHKLGNMGDTTAFQAREMLEPMGVKVDIVEPLISAGVPVSSTRIRIAVEEGDFSTVENLLGRKHELDLEGLDIKKGTSSPLIRRNDIKQVIPLRGRYAVDLANGRNAFAAKINILEDRITFDDYPDFQVETLTFNSLL
ncbi:MAG: FAD synthetase family protein [Spirochaetales bacterium]|nr:FAD synthetase family protein [Spirochaetales bacterium]